MYLKPPAGTWGGHPLMSGLWHCTLRGEPEQAPNTEETYSKFAVYYVCMCVCVYVVICLSRVHNISAHYIFVILMRMF